MNGPLRTTVKDGQAYVDEPVQVLPNKLSPLELALCHVFKRVPPQPITVGYERIRLRWMKPGKNGKAVPR